MRNLQLDMENKNLFEKSFSKKPKRARQGVPAVKKVVMLAGGYGHALMPLSKHIPPCMFPLFNRPLVEHNLDSLELIGIEDAIIIHSGFNDEQISELGKIRSKINIHLFEEECPVGTAGSLKDVAHLIDDEPFIVMNSNLYLGDLALHDLIGFHSSSGAVLTAAVEKRDKSDSCRRRESVMINEDRTIGSVHLIHYSRDTRSPWVFLGMYIMSPQVLDLMEEGKYFDIKEQLIPVLKENDHHVCAMEAEGYYKNIFAFNDYTNLHRELLEENEGRRELSPLKKHGDDIWIGEDVSISPDAFLLGPLVLGSGCRISEGAKIIGPAVIGHNTTVSNNALLRESIVWHNVNLESGSRVEYSILISDFSISKDETLKSAIGVDKVDIGDYNLLSSYDRRIYDVGDGKSYSIHNAYNLFKRGFDFMGALLGLTLFFPIMLVAAIIIKLDSPGPVFFAQRRCGENGKEFKMLKFRTMVSDAEKNQKKLFKNNEVDGPMFKMTSDPRLTRSGKYLRKTSVDELPQLVNVLKGEMSLIGPRPLVMDEMLYNPKWRDLRLTVKPGITGLWQINGRSNTNFDAWIKHDVFYVKNQSFLLDIKIVLKTIWVTLKRAGAH